MVVIHECDEMCMVIAPTTSLEKSCLWDQYMESFRSKSCSIDWGFINMEVYGDFDNLSFASDTDFVSLPQVRSRSPWNSPAYISI